jgi:hypothetical protein
MWESDIPVERRYGVTRCVRARVFDRDLTSILAMFGLSQDAGSLVEVSADKAQEILQAILWKDLAYCAEIMPQSKAGEFAREFVMQQIALGANFYTNADWAAYMRNKNGFSWSGLTSATFDGGVIAIGGGFASCVWVEDED